MFSWVCFTVLQTCGHAISHMWDHVYNSNLASGYVPGKWKRASAAWFRVAGELEKKVAKASEAVQKKCSELIKMVFCYQNYSDMMWEKIDLVIEKNFWNSRLKAKNFQNFLDH